MKPVPHRASVFTCGHMCPHDVARLKTEVNLAPGAATDWKAVLFGAAHLAGPMSARLNRKGFQTGIDFNRRTFLSYARRVQPVRFGQAQLRTVELRLSPGTSLNRQPAGLGTRKSAQRVALMAAASRKGA